MTLGITGTAEIHGYIGGDFEFDAAEKAGQLFEGIGNMLSKVESAAAWKTRHCALVGGTAQAQAQAPTLEGQLAVQESQQAILENQREIKLLLQELLRNRSRR